MRIIPLLALLGLAPFIGTCTPQSMLAGLAAQTAIAAAKSIANSPQARQLVANTVGMEPASLEQTATYILTNEQQGLVLLKAMVDPVTARASWPLWTATRTRQVHLSEKWTEFYQADPEHAQQVAGFYNGQITAVLIQELYEMQRINSDLAIQQELLALRTSR